MFLYGIKKCWTHVENFHRDGCVAYAGTRNNKAVSQKCLSWSKKFMIVNISLFISQVGKVKKYSNTKIDPIF